MNARFPSSSSFFMPHVLHTACIPPRRWWRGGTKKMLKKKTTTTSPNESTSIMYKFSEQMQERTMGEQRRSVSKRVSWYEMWFKKSLWWKRRLINFNLFASRCFNQKHTFWPLVCAVHAAAAAAAFLVVAFLCDGDGDVGVDGNGTSITAMTTTTTTTTAVAFHFSNASNHFVCFLAASFRNNIYSVDFVTLNNIIRLIFGVMPEIISISISIWISCLCIIEWKTSE